MTELLKELFASHGGVLTTAQIVSVIPRGVFRGMVRRREIVALWHGVYTNESVTLDRKLRGLRIAYEAPVTACLGTAAALHGFDTENAAYVHIVDPRGNHAHGHRGVVLHQRLGAPVVRVGDHMATGPAWTAIEVARSLTRPRALATLDAALSTSVVTHADLDSAARAQAGRRGIAQVRPLISLADGRAGSPMESEARLVMLDGGLPSPELQLPVLDERGIPVFYLDFAWEDAKVGVEYDGDEFHSTAMDVRRDKARTAWLQDRGWLMIPITADDVRRWPRRLVARIDKHLRERRIAA